MLTNASDISSLLAEVDCGRVRTETVCGGLDAPNCALAVQAVAAAKAAPKVAKPATTAAPAASTPKVEPFSMVTIRSALEEVCTLAVSDVKRFLCCPITHVRSLSHPHASPRSAGLSLAVVADTNLSRLFCCYGVARQCSICCAHAAMPKRLDSSAQ